MKLRLANKVWDNYLHKYPAKTLKNAHRRLWKAISANNCYFRNLRKKK